MNTILFLSGAGVGALVATLLMLLVMARAVRKSSKDTAETIQLIKERNSLDQAKVSHLATIAGWCEHNWSK